MVCTVKLPLLLYRSILGIHVGKLYKYILHLTQAIEGQGLTDIMPIFYTGSKANKNLFIDQNRCLRPY